MDRVTWGMLVRSIAIGFVALWMSFAAPAVAGDGPEGFVLLDRRPAEESKFKNYSSLITSCDYAITRMSDKGQVAGRIARLETDLRAAFGDALKGRTIEVTRYVIYFNGHTFFRTRAKAAPAGQGLLPGLMYGMGDCPKERTTVAWYEPGEVTTPNSPFIAEATVRIDGADYSVRTVYSPRSQLYASLKTKAQENEALGEAIGQANAALIVALEATLKQ